MQVPSRQLVAVTEGAHRLIRWADDPGRGELYNLEKDSRELVKRIADEPDVARQLEARLETYLDSTPPRWQPDEIAIDDMDLKQLRALGYAIE